MRFIILVCCLLVLSAAVGQSVDSSFTAPIPLRQAKIEKILPAANGKFFIGGEITYHGNTRVHNLIKVHADGTLDNTFNFDRTYYSGTSGRSFLVTDIAQQPSGELVVIIHDYDPGLYIIEYASILLLNPDGSLINEKKIYSQVTALALQDDGKILVGGGGQLRRYHSDLTEDIQFNSKVTFNNSWISKVQQKDDYILVAGSFEYVNNVSHNQMVKLNLDGTIASGFNTGIGTNTGSNGAISTFFILDDGKVMIGFAPGFQGFNLHRGMGRLNADGSLDQSWPARFHENDTLNISFGSDYMLYDGTSFYVGGFASVDTPPYLTSHLVKLDNNGAIDVEFEPIKLKAMGVFDSDAVLTQNGIILDNLSFSDNRFGLAKYDFDANRIEDFELPLTRLGTITFGDSYNDKLIISGDFFTVNGFDTNSIATLSSDGQVKTDFTQVLDIGAVSQIDILEDGGALVTNGLKLIKLKSDGTVDTSFQFRTFNDSYFFVEKFIRHQDKIIASTSNALFWLKPDGTVDTDRTLIFEVTSTWLFDFDLQGDKIIYGGDIQSLNGQPISKLVRINADGTVDSTFNIGSGPGPAREYMPEGVTMVKVLNNNEILIAGNFLKFNDEWVPHGLVKLDPHGGVDTEFLKNQRLGVGPPPDLRFDHNTVEQIGSKIFIGQPNNKAFYVLDVDGVEESDFLIPGNVNMINDIIPATGKEENSGGRLAQLNSALVEKHVVISGLFTTPDAEFPSSMVKLKILDNPKEKPLSMLAYPNPTEETLTVYTNSQDGIIKVSMRDIQGNLIIEADAQSQLGRFGIDLKPFPSGFYILSVKSPDGRVAKSRVIKRK